MIIKQLQNFLLNKLQKIYKVVGLILVFAILMGAKVSDEDFENLINTAEQLGQSNPDSAILILNQFNTQNILDLQAKGKIYFLEAKIYKSLALTDSIKYYFNLALDCFSATNSKQLQADVYHQYGNYYFGTGNFELAKQYYFKASHIRDSLHLTAEQNNTLSNLGMLYSRLGNIDSAIICHNNVLNISQATGDSSGISHALSNLGNIYLAKTDLNTAIDYYNRALSYIDTTIPDDVLASLINNIGNIYTRQGKLASALYEYQRAIHISQKCGYTKGIPLMLNNIALIHVEMNNIDEAMKYHTEALEYFTERNDLTGVAQTYLYLGRIYHKIKKYDSAKSLYLQALEGKEQLSDKNGIADCMHNLGVLFTDVNRLDSAAYYLNYAIQIYRELNYAYGLANGLNNLSKVNYILGNYSQSFNNAKKALETAEQFDGLAEKMEAYLNMANTREAQSRFHESLNYYRQYSTFKDSLLNTEKAALVLTLENKYQREKQQKELDEQKFILKQRTLEYEYKDQQYKIQKRLQLVLIVLLFILSVFFIVIIRNLNSKKAINKMLIEQRKFIISKNDELAHLNTEMNNQQQHIKKQNEILIAQNLKIEEINANWQESVNYAQYIQQSILPSDKLLTQLFPNSFLLYLPKDTVSGDFYWASQHDNKTILAVGDCTGHGVSGGFLSMIGMSILKEIIRVNQILNPAKILEDLRNTLIATLQQQSSILEYNDGIDLSVIIIDNKTQILDFAGARSKGLIISNKKVVELTGDTSSAGHSPKPKPYTNKQYQLKQGDTIYLFTDGYCDQYNNSGIKIGMRQFTNTLIEVNTQQLSTQREILYNNFITWKENIEQIDDITVLAIRI